MCPIKVVRNGQKRAHWIARWQQTAMLVRSVLNTHAATRECWVSEWWHGSRHPGRMGRLWGCWKPSTAALWAPWMRAERCHMGPSCLTGLWPGRMKWKMSYLCPNLNGTEKDTVPLRTELVKARVQDCAWTQYPGHAQVCTAGIQQRLGN